MELISREVVLNTIRNLEGELAGEGKPSPHWVEVTNWLYISIAKLPIERIQKGKWIEKGEGNMWKCSLCGNERYVDNRDDFPNYCDECGADMREENVATCDRNKCYENEINDISCDECECYSAEKKNNRTFIIGKGEVKPKNYYILGRDKGTENNEEVLKIIEKLKGSIVNRTHAIYNLGYKDGAKNAIEKLAVDILADMRGEE